MRNLRLIVILLACLSAIGVAAWASHRHPVRKHKPVAKHAAKKVEKKPSKPWLRDEDEKDKNGVEQDAPDKAIEWLHQAWKDNNGNIPPNGLLNALKEREQKLQFQSNTNLGFTPNWTFMGPNNQGGRTNALAINPNNTAMILAGAAGGGVWKSTDAGVHWTPINERWSPLSMGSIIYDPNNASVVYAGTGEASTNQDAIAGGGIYKSTDGGNTFSLMPSTANFQAVGEITVQPGNSNVILVGTRTGGLQRSIDGGATWTNVINEYGCYNVRFSNQNPNNALCSIVDLTGGVYTNYLEYSTDAGQTWTVSAGTLDNTNGRISRIQFCYAPSDNTIVYTSQGNGNGNVYTNKSTDGGHTFGASTAQGWGTTQLWYDNALWVDPTNANRVIQGALDIWETTDGGSTWNQIGYWANNYNDPNLPHADDHVIINDPGYNGTTNKIVYVGNDGGVFRANDITTANTNSGWTVLNAGYATTQFYGASGDGPTGTYLGGTQDNGTIQLATGSAAGVEEFGGDGGYAAVDGVNPNFLFGEYVYAYMHRSTDHGASADWIYSGIGDAGGQANFISPFILSPHSHTTLLVGASSLWRSTNAEDATPSWAAIRSPGSAFITAVAEAPSDADTVWVGQKDGGLSKSTNATSASPTWTDIPALGSRFVGRIAFDPTTANTVYVGLGGYTTPNLYKSTDGGSTWAPLVGSGSTGLPAAPIRGVCVDPLNPQWIFVGTEVGLYFSTDGGLTWSTSNFGPTNASVNEVTFVQNAHTLLVATHGRGIWSAPVPLPNAVVGLTAAPGTEVAGNPTTGTVTIQSMATGPGVTVNLSSDNISAVTVPSSVLVPAGQNSVQFPITTHGVDAAVTANVTATGGGATTSTPIRVTVATFAYMVSAPGSVVAGYKPNLDLQLNGAAGPSSITVNLTSSDSSVASIPTTATFPPFTHLIAVPITTYGVDSSASVTFTGKQGTGPLRSCSLTVNAAALRSLTAQPSPIYGGQASNLFVYLTGPAGPSGVTVNLTSDNSAVASLQSSVVIPSGTSSIKVPVATVGVDTQQAIPLRAQIGSGAVVASNALVVNPASVYLAVVSPTSVKGGTRTTFVVYLLGTPGPSGVTVNLTSSDTTNAPLPATLFFPAGTTRQSVSVLTKAVTASESVTLSARIGAVTQSATLRITP